MPHDVFISYAARGKDKLVADAVCAELEKQKIRCWIAPRDVPAGQSFAGSIVESIKNARVFVIVFSDNSNQSPQVLREVERAVHKGIPIVPFRIEEFTPTKDMEYFLSSTHWLDALTSPLEKHLHRLANTVRYLLDKPIEKSGKLSLAEVDQDEEPSKNIKISKEFFLISIIAGLTLSIILDFWGLMVLDQDLLLAETLLGFALLPYLYALVVWFVFIYKMWTVIPKKYARTTPGKAVGFLFIPFYNLYWIFQAVWGFARDFNSYIAARDFNISPLPTNLFLSFVIIWLLAGFISTLVYEITFLLNIAIAIILTIMVSNICDRIKALSEQR